MKLGTHISVSRSSALVSCRAPWLRGGGAGGAAGAGAILDTIGPARRRLRSTRLYCRGCAKYLRKIVKDLSEDSYTYVTTCVRRLPTGK